MDTTDGSAPDRLRMLLAGLGLTRAEAAAVLMLALGALAGLGLLWWLQQPSSVGAGVEETQPDGGVLIEPLEDEVVVHVVGLVHAPGLHRLTPGARVADALDAAGGALAEAELSALNLARHLEDGEQLLVPARADPAAEPAEAGEPPAAPAPAGIAPDGTVHLNRATPAELETLPGIGPVMAERIIDHREQHGPFTSVGQLREVRGIGEKTFQALADLVAL